MLSLLRRWSGLRTGAKHEYIMIGCRGGNEVVRDILKMLRLGWDTSEMI